MMLANPAAAMLQGAQIGAQMKQMRTQNALAQLYQTQGPALMAGDPNALNMAAQLDPLAAQGLQQGAQQTQLNEAKLAEIQRAASGEAMKAAQGMDDAARAKEAEHLTSVMNGAAFFVSKGDEKGYMQFMGQQGVPPDQVPPFAMAPAVIAMAKGGLDALSSFDKRNAPAPGPTYRPATADEAAKYGAAGGQIDTATGKFDPINPPSGGTTVFGPDGKPVVQIGGQGKGQTPAQAALLGPDAMISQIDGILNDPNLDKSTGMLSILQKVPGTAQYDFGAKAKQLNGQAFLQAFNALRGGGAITEMEGQKATEAIAALDTAQSPDAYRKNLNTLRDILAKAQSGTAAQSTLQDKTATQNFTAMQPKDLLAIDPTTLQGADLQAYIDRIGQLTGNK